MSEKIESLITKMVQGKSADAESEFNAIISQKASDAIERLRADVVDRMFNESVFGAGAKNNYGIVKHTATGSDKAGDKMPSTYGNKRDHKKIDLHANGKYLGSTSWSPNVKTAVSKAEEKWPEHKGKIKGFYAESPEVNTSDEEFYLVEGGLGGKYGVGDPGVQKATDAIKNSLAKSGITDGGGTSTVIRAERDKKSGKMYQVTYVNDKVTGRKPL